MVGRITDEDLLRQRELYWLCQDVIRAMRDRLYKAKGYEPWAQKMFWEELPEQRRKCEEMRKDLNALAFAKWLQDRIFGCVPM